MTPTDRPAPVRAARRSSSVGDATRHFGFRSAAAEFRRASQWSAHHDLEHGTFMSFTLRSARRVAPTVPTSADEAASLTDATSGRVGFDSRGNAVWEWRTADHEFVREGSTSLVRKLEVSQLSNESTAIAKRRLAPQIERQASAATASATVPIGTGGGFNRYHRSGRAVAKARAGKHAAPRTPSKIVVTSRSKPGLFDRLREWIGVDSSLRRQMPSGSFDLAPAGPARRKERSARHCAGRHGLPAADFVQSMPVRPAGAYSSTIKWADCSETLANS